MSQIKKNSDSPVIAPVFFGFVHWTLEEAKRQGIRRLYFMARDGQILWKIAQISSCQLSVTRLASSKGIGYGRTPSP